LASLSLLDGENLPTVNVGAHNSDTDYHRYLGTLQPPSPLNLSQAMPDDVVLKPQAVKSKHIFFIFYNQILENQKYQKAFRIKIILEKSGQIEHACILCMREKIL
jgi:hypothetical protein